MKTKIFTDGTTCIPRDMAIEKDIGFVEFLFMINNKPIKEFSEIDREEFINGLRFMDPYPASSFPSAPDYLEAFKKAEDDGYDEIFYICLNYNISNAMNSARMAAKKIKKAKITIYDSGIMGVSQGIMVLIAEKLLKRGKSVDEVVKYLDSVKHKIYGAGCSVNFETLFRTGRVKKGVAISVIASALSLKPVFELNFEVGVTSIGGGIGFKGAIKKIVSNIVEKTDEKMVHDLYMIDAYNPKLLKKLEKEILKVRKVKNIYYWDMVSMMAHTCGKGSVVATLGPTLDEI